MPGRPQQPDPEQPDLEQLDPEQLDPRVVEAARARAASLADEIEADAVERAVARVRERLTDEYASVLEQAVLDELVQRARARDESRVAELRPAAEPAPTPTPNPEPTPGAPPTVRSTPPEQAGSPAADEPLGWYLYALVAGPRTDLDLEAGLDPAFAVEVLGDEELAAVGSPARLSMLQAGQEGADLSPDGWFATALRRHEQLVEMSGETVIPMRFGTVYPDADRIRAVLERHRAVILDELRRLAGQAEWGVKLIATQPSAPVRPEREPDAAAPVSGAGYLRSKAETRSTARAASEARRELVARVHDQLAACATAAVVTPVQRTGRDTETMLLNASYLVRADEVDAFQGTIRRLAEAGRDDGLEVQLTGPWPPYHFVELRLADEGGSA